MAPNVLSLKTRKENKIKINNSQKIKKRILEFQNFIKNNFENVGNDFAYKARSIHYNHKKNSKGIYGTASKKQIRELQEEGIDTQVFPWIEDKKN
tara:strand:+ start:1788 stop:2072 length:285 start_codon:yes stop_codon:yes gene_type:complete